MSGRQTGGRARIRLRDILGPSSGLGGQHGPTLKLSQGWPYRTLGFKLSQCQRPDCFAWMSPRRIWTRLPSHKGATQESPLGIGVMTCDPGASIAPVREVRVPPWIKFRRRSAPVASDVRDDDCPWSRALLGHDGPTQDVYNKCITCTAYSMQLHEPDVSLTI